MSALIVVLPAPDGPTRAVIVPGSTVKESFLKISPESTTSRVAIPSSDANEISSAFG